MALAVVFIIEDHEEAGTTTARTNSGALEISANFALTPRQLPVSVTTANKFPI